MGLRLRWGCGIVKEKTIKKQKKAEHINKQGLKNKWFDLYEQTSPWPKLCRCSDLRLVRDN